MVDAILHAAFALSWLGLFGLIGGVAAADFHRNGGLMPRRVAVLEATDHVEADRG